MTIEGRRRYEADAPDLMVAQPRGGGALAMELAGALLFGGFVFWQMSAQRTHHETARLTQGAPVAIAQSGSPPADPSPAPLFTAAPEEPLLGAAAPAADANTPALIVDLSDGPAVDPGQRLPGHGAVLPAGDSPAGDAITGAVAPDRDTAFAERLGVGRREGATRARPLGDPTYTSIQGTMIPAVLETAVNSELPGYVRAVVSRDVKGFDGVQTLVPRGSRLVGQYRSGVALGQSRAFVIWTRLVRPDGVSVALAAPGTDALGQGGLEGRVDRHFLQRFGGAMLLSLIGGVGAVAGGDASIIIASSRNGGAAAPSAFAGNFDIAPTVSVASGAPVNAFLARDLDFSVLATTAD